MHVQNRRGCFGRSGWIQEVVLGVGGGAGATQGVLGHVHTLGNRTRRSVSDGGACVPGVLNATKLEGLVAGVIIPELRKPADCPAMCDDVEEPQKLAA